MLWNILQLEVEHQATLKQANNYTVHHVIMTHNQLTSRCEKLWSFTNIKSNKMLSINNEMQYKKN